MMHGWTLLLWVAGGLLAGFLAWGAFLLRRSLGGSIARLGMIEIASIPGLAEECRGTVRERLKIDLDPRRPEETARALDELVLTGRLRTLFKADGYDMRYVEPVGAFLGELIRRHAGAEWVEDARGPRVRVHRPDGEEELEPFQLALRHHTHGTPGQLHAWVMSAVR